MVNIDMWYGDDWKTCDQIIVTFYSNGEYRGNILKAGKYIGDYTADDSVELEKKFSHLHFNWDR